MRRHEGVTELTSPAGPQNPGVVGLNTNITTAEKEALEGLGASGISVGHQISICFSLRETRFLYAVQADLNLESPASVSPGLGVLLAFPRKTFSVNGKLLPRTSWFVAAGKHLPSIQMRWGAWPWTKAFA